MYDTICSDYAYLTGRTVRQADADIKHLSALMQTYVKRGKRLEIPGLGVFEAKKRKGTNPRTGKPQTSKRIYFRSSKVFREAIK